MRLESKERADRIDADSDGTETAAWLHFWWTWHANADTMGKTAIATSKQV